MSAKSIEIPNECFAEKMFCKVARRIAGASGDTSLAQFISDAGTKRQRLSISTQDCPLYRSVDQCFSLPIGLGTPRRLT